MCLFVYCSYFSFFFFKQKTAYEMRISDWSSDVCSSDLFLSLLSLKAEMVTVDLPGGAHKTPGFLARNPFGQVPVIEDGDFTLADSNAILEIGRASCRERVCQYV